MSRALPRAAALHALALLLAGCVTAPPTWDKPVPSFAQPPRTEGRFAALETAITSVRGPDISGFRLLESNADGQRAAEDRDGPDQVAECSALPPLGDTERRPECLSSDGVRLVA